MKTINNFLSKKMKFDAEYFISSGIIISLGQIIVNLLHFLLIWLFANFTSKDSYGFYVYGFTLIGLLTIFTLPGVLTSFRREVALGNEGVFLPLWKTSFKWGFLGSIICIIIVLSNIADNSGLNTFLVFCSFALPLRGSNSIYTGYYNGKKNFKMASVLSILLASIVTFVVGLTILLAKNVFLALIFSITCEIIFNSVVCLYIYLHLNQTPLGEEEAISYGKKLSFLTIPDIIAHWIDKLVVGSLLGLEDLAIYSIVTVVPENIKFLVKPIGRIAFPKFVVMNEHDARKRLFLALFQLVLFASIIVLGYILLSPMFFSIVFPKYKDEVWLSQIFMLYFVISPWSILYGSYLEAKKKTERLFALRLTFAITLILLIVVLVPPFGLLGVVLARLFARIFSSALLLAIFFKDLIRN